MNDVNGSKAGDCIARLTAVSLEFRGPPVVNALREVSVTIERGEFVTIMGVSGSGKSSLLSILGMLQSPTSGGVELFGANAAGMPDAERATLRAEKIGFVFQAFHLLDDRTVLDNVLLPMQYASIERRRPTVTTGDRVDIAMAALARVGLADRCHQSAAPLSGGERQRVAIARGIASGAELILADEPTGSLDSATGATIVDVLEGLVGSNCSVVAVTHNSELAARGTRRLMMVDGRIA